MKKIYWGLTKEQIWILLILSAGILAGAILKYASSWDNTKVYQHFRQDSLFLAAKMEAYYSDTVYHSQQLMAQYVDSLAESYGIESSEISKGKSPAPLSPASPVNINTAGISELVRVKGIGVTTAERIITYRKKNGPFNSMEELKKIKGIGPKKLEKMAPFLKIAD